MIYSGNAIRVAATCQPATTAKIHPQWKANFTIFMDKQLKLETNRRGRRTFSVQLYTGNGFSSSVFCKQLEEADRQHADDGFWLFYSL